MAYQGPGDYHLHSLDAASGELFWRHTRDEARWSRPVVVAGVVFATANEDRPPQTPGDPAMRSLLFHADVVALGARTGAVLWEFQTVGDASAQVVVNGVVYVSADDGRSYVLEDPPGSGNPAMRGRVYALDASTGDLMWQRRAVAEVGAGLRGPMVVEGVVYVESSDQFRYNDPRNLPALPICGQLTAFDAFTGETKWVFETDDQFSEPPAVQHGVAYSVTVNGQVHPYALTQEISAGFASTQRWCACPVGAPVGTDSRTRQSATQLAPDANAQVRACLGGAEACAI